MRETRLLYLLVTLVVCEVSLAFAPPVSSSFNGKSNLFSSKAQGDSNDDLSALLTSRLPTSVEDQVRQAAESLKRATSDGIHRHAIRLLLPVIGATELDDWPGGARQMMEAANPLLKDILQRMNDDNDSTKKKNKDNAGLNIQTMIIDESDGVAALMAQDDNPQNDSCTVLLPTADTVVESLQNNLDQQVGPKRNLIIVNPQWRRRSDFGGTFFFGSQKADQTINYVQQYQPTFSLTNLICEGESIRVLRTYPGPWRVFLQTIDKDTKAIDWIQIGTKDYETAKPSDWDKRVENQKDGGLLFNYGMPTYQEINDMINSAPNYTPKTLEERAQAAFMFIKDSL